MQKRAQLEYEVIAKRHFRLQMNCSFFEPGYISKNLAPFYTNSKFIQLKFHYIPIRNSYLINTYLLLFFVKINVKIKLETSLLTIVSVIIVSGTSIATNNKNKKYDPFFSVILKFEI